jgi:type IV pilus assembly protein PilF
MTRGPALPRLLLTCGALLTAFGLVGCAAPPAAEEPREIRTVSDLTDADRRSRVRLELAAAYFGRGQMTTALDEVKLALLAKPDMPEAFNLRGLIYATLGEPRLAEESFQRALQLAPRDADTLQNYAWFLCQQRRFPEADQLFERALAQPQYQGAVRTLLAQGVCQARAGQLPQAELTLTKSYELDPSSPVTAFNLSDVLYRRGDYQRARFYIARVNAQPEASNAQTLWLAARVEMRLGNSATAQMFGRQLRERFPQSAEALQFERGRFDD